MLDRQEVESALDKIRPFLKRDGGDVQLVEITDDNVLKVKLVGACGHCPMSTMTLKSGIEAELKKRFSNLKSVEAV